MTPRQEKAPRTQQEITVRSLAVGGAVVATVAAVLVSGGALRLLGHGRNSRLRVSTIANPQAMFV